MGIKVVEILTCQEIIWKVKPDLIIEMGIAHGGSLIFSASVLALLDYCNAFESGEVLDPHKPKRKVIGVDIDIRAHNREALDNHPLRNRLELIHVARAPLEPSGMDTAVPILSVRQGSCFLWNDMWPSAL